MHLLARDSPTAHAAAEYPVDAAVAVVGAAVAVLAERAPELAQHDDDSIVPRAAHFVRERADTATELFEPVREIALRAALPCMGVQPPTSMKPTLNRSRMSRATRRASSSKPRVVSALRLAASISSDISFIT